MVRQFRIVGVACGICVLCSCAAASLYVPRFVWNDVIVNDMTIDAAGSIYTTGEAIDPNSDDKVHDVGMAKYDAQGNLLWRRTCDGPLKGFDYGTDVELDVHGNIHVLGSMQLTPKGTRRWGGFSTGYLLLKYTRDGELVWKASYEDPNSSNDDGILGLGADGCCYVTGRSERRDGTGYRYGIITMKYDAGGNRVWTDLFTGSINDASPSHITVDAGQSVYVSGSSDGKYHTGDAVIVKYDRQGRELWTLRQGGEPGKYYLGSGLALDDAGNLYEAVNYSDRQERVRVILSNYDPDGRLLWRRVYRKGDQDTWASDLLVEGGVVHLAAYTDRRYLYVKYDGDGFRLSTVGEKGMSMGGKKLFAGRDGCVYLSAVGTADVRFEAEGLLMKIDAQGTWMWTKTYSTPAQLAAIMAGD